MTYLEILGWARKGIRAEQNEYRDKLEKGIEKHIDDIVQFCQQRIDEMDVKFATLEELEDIHNRK